MNNSPLHSSAEALEAQPQASVGVSIDVVDLTYGVTKDKAVKRLLKNVSVSLKAGTMCALMGPSGAGNLHDQTLYLSIS
jgi:ABC-type glutathione transport system ATPase component